MILTKWKREEFETELDSQKCLIVEIVISRCAYKKPNFEIEAIIIFRAFNFPFFQISKFWYGLLELF